MFQIKNYKWGIDLQGILLFLLIMIPNIIWFLIPAPVDTLRKESITPAVDTVAQVFQILMVAALAAIQNQKGLDNRKGKTGFVIFLFLAFYYVGWILYYAGIVNAVVHLDLCIAPCMAFIVFSCWRRNVAALISAIGFTTCHIIFVYVNFFGVE